MSTFLYVQTVDSGLAPCVHGRVWSLALCKPAIRRAAEGEDVVIAVSPSADGHRLSSWARIARRIATPDFYTSYPATRPDNIYRPTAGGRFVRHDQVRHRLHASDEDLAHDLGADGESACVLISKDFYAFGDDALPLEEWIEGRSHLRGGGGSTWPRHPPLPRPGRRERPAGPCPLSSQRALRPAQPLLPPPASRGQSGLRLDSREGRPRPLQLTDSNLDPRT